MEHYHEEIPKHIVEPLKGLKTECSAEAIIYGIGESVTAKKRTFAFIAKCARNYIPPAPTDNANYANGRYSVDIPGVIHMLPTSNAPPLPLRTDDPWAIALVELTPTLPGRTGAWLAGSTLAPNGELAGVPFYRLTVRTEASNLPWLRQQAEPAIRKKVGSILGKRVELEIVAAESVTP